MDIFTYVNVEQLADELYVLEECGSNIFLIKGKEKVLVLDTAYGLTDIKAAVKTLCGDLPMICVNSHEHFDHNGGNNQFNEVHVGRFGEQGSHAPVVGAAKQRLREFIGNRLDGKPFDYDQWTPGPAPKIVPIQTGDCFDLGGIRLQVIETPGHAPGAIALYEPNKKWLFIGDTVLDWEVWGQLSTSLALRCYAQTLHQLAALEPKLDIVFPSHSVAGAPGELQRFCLPPRILSIYAEGTQEIVDGKVTGEDYSTLNAGFPGCRYVNFEIGGMAYDPARI